MRTLAGVVCGMVLPHNTAPVRTVARDETPYSYFGHQIAFSHCADVFQEMESFRHAWGTPRQPACKMPIRAVLLPEMINKDKYYNGLKSKLIRQTAIPLPLLELMCRVELILSYATADWFKPLVSLSPSCLLSCCCLLVLVVLLFLFFALVLPKPTFWSLNTSAWSSMLAKTSCRKVFWK